MSSDVKHFGIRTDQTITNKWNSGCDCVRLIFDVSGVLRNGLCCGIAIHLTLNTEINDKQVIDWWRIDSKWTCLMATRQSKQNTHTLIWNIAKQRIEKQINLQLCITTNRTGRMRCFHRNSKTQTTIHLVLFDIYYCYYYYYSVRRLVSASVVLHIHRIM